MARTPRSDKTTRTYLLSFSLIARIDEQAALLEAYPSHVVQLLLDRALAEVEAGRWTLNKRPTYFRPEWRRDGQ